MVPIFRYVAFAHRRYGQVVRRIPFVRVQRYLHSFSELRFAELCSAPASKFQVYSSLSHDPFFNLSIEHYLLQKTPPDSTILLFYVNEPCVVIGRNQNPWLEANLRYMATSPINVPDSSLNEGRSRNFYVELVRRRSGGGTVFHDFQNINFSVIRPSSEFTRDKSVEMVVKAIREVNPRTRVNERHDIVLDMGPLLDGWEFPDDNDAHKTCFAPGIPLKVSGSAYKLTRNRSLHHGTCLLNSPNLRELSKYLNSPFRPFINAKGVDSVRSPVSNLYNAKSQADCRLHIEKLVSNAFRNDYCPSIDFHTMFSEEDRLMRRLVAKGNWVAATLDETLAEIPEIKAGMRELMVNACPSSSVWSTEIFASVAGLALRPNTTVQRNYTSFRSKHFR